MKEREQRNLIWREREKERELRGSSLDLEREKKRGKNRSRERERECEGEKENSWEMIVWVRILRCVKCWCDELLLDGVKVRFYARTRLNLFYYFNRLRNYTLKTKKTKEKLIILINFLFVARSPLSFGCMINYY